MMQILLESYCHLVSPHISTGVFHDAELEHKNRSDFFGLWEKSLYSVHSRLKLAQL